LIHFIIVECVPIGIFALSMYSCLKGLAIAGIERYLDGTGFEIPGNTTISVFEDCMEQFAITVIWEVKTYAVADCVAASGHQNMISQGDSGASDLDGDERILAIFPGAIFVVYMLSGIFSVYCFTKFLGCFRGSLSSTTAASGKYLHFIYDLRLQKAYRIFAGAFVFFTLMLLLGLMCAFFMFEMLTFFVQTQLTVYFAVVVSMRAFTSPAKPKFDYKMEEFKNIDFKRTSFFQSNSAFAVKLSSALISAQRGNHEKLESMLIKKGEWKVVLKIACKGSGKNGTRSTPRRRHSCWDMIQAFATGNTEALANMAIEKAIAKLQPVLEPMLEKEGLTWTDMQPILDEIDTLEEIENAILDPGDFMTDKLANSSSPIARKWAIAKLKPKLEPMLEKEGLTWPDAVPKLESVTTDLAQLDPDSFVQSLKAKPLPTVLVGSRTTDAGK